MQFDAKHQRVKQSCFGLREHENGLSVFSAGVATARSTLQSFVDDTTARADTAVGAEQEKAHKLLEQYPDVETMVAKGWHVVKIPVTEILNRGFSLSPTEPNGHLEIQGTREQFNKYEQDFTQLVEDKVAPLLSSEECLKHDI